MRNPAKRRRPSAARPQAQHTHAGPLATLTADDRAGEESVARAPVELRHSLKGQQPAASCRLLHQALNNQLSLHRMRAPFQSLNSVILFYVVYFYLFVLFVKGQYIPI